jgi:hypothetical protein
LFEDLCVYFSPTSNFAQFEQVFLSTSTARTALPVAGSTWFVRSFLFLIFLFCIQFSSWSVSVVSGWSDGRDLYPCFQLVRESTGAWYDFLPLLYRFLRAFISGLVDIEYLSTMTQGQWLLFPAFIGMAAWTLSVSLSFCSSSVCFLSSSSLMV